MALVRIPSPLRHLSAGEREVEVAADDVRGLVRALGARFPGLDDALSTALGKELAVAIDGEIFNDPLLEAIESDSEIDFLPRISGGA